MNKINVSIYRPQFCEGENKYCSEAVKSVVRVASCPTSLEEWSRAASKKNCTENATQQSCTTADKFVYHCVINSYRNETLEVCAPRRVITGISLMNCLSIISIFLIYFSLQLNKVDDNFSLLGHCTEFNVVGGIIQSHSTVSCNKTFPKCDKVYKSSDAYKCTLIDTCLYKYINFMLT